MENLIDIGRINKRSKFTQIKSFFFRLYVNQLIYTVIQHKRLSEHFNTILQKTLLVFSSDARQFFTPIQQIHDNFGSFFDQKSLSNPLYEPFLKRHFGFIGSKNSQRLV